MPPLILPVYYSIEKAEKQRKFKNRQKVIVKNPVSIRGVGVTKKKQYKSVGGEKCSGGHRCEMH